MPFVCFVTWWIKKETSSKSSHLRPVRRTENSIRVHLPGGFALLPLIGLLAVMTMIAAMLAPNFARDFDRKKVDDERETLIHIGAGTRLFLERNFLWPTDLTSHVPKYVGLSDQSLMKNPNGYPRYYFLHPTMAGFTNQTGLAANALPNARFLLISDLSQDASPVIANATEFESWWAVDTSTTPDLVVYRGNVANQFHRVSLTANGKGGSYQIAGQATNSYGTKLTPYDTYHLAGTVIALDEASVYGTPEVTFALSTDVAFAFIPCLPAGSQWRIAPGPVCPVLWLSTKDRASGTPGLSSWTPSQIVAFMDPNLTYEPGPTGTTNGNFSLAFDLNNFTGGANIDAMHYVARPVVVGDHELLVGDLLLSTRKKRTLRSTNTLTVRGEDLFGFRPDVVNDYSSGTFFIVIDGSDVNLKQIEAVTLVEVERAIRDSFVPAGTFLLTGEREDDDQWDQNDVYQFVPKTVGERTSGTFALFLDTSDINVSEKITGIALVEEQTDLGDITLQAGQILITLEKDDKTVGDNKISTNMQDVIILDITAVGSKTRGTATLLFDGSDVGMSNEKENINALTLNGLST